MTRPRQRAQRSFSPTDTAISFCNSLPVISRYSWICMLLLMANHYHLLIETPKRISRLASFSSTAFYTQSFTPAQTMGHLFQGRFKLSLWRKNSIFWRLCHTSAQSGASQAQWPDRSVEWTVTATVFRRVPEFLTVDWVLGQFGKSGDAQRLCQRRIGNRLGRNSEADL